MIDRTDLLRKVHALLSKAESSPFSEEAQTFREKADQMMVSYQIQEFELENAGKKKKSKPSLRTDISISEAGSVVRDQMVDLFSAVCRHCGVKPVYYNLRYRKARVYASAVGFEEDIQYAEVLFTTLRMSLVGDLSPKYDPSISKDKNVRVMKEAGMNWERIAQLCDLPYPGSACISAYKRQCQADGTEPIKANPTNYVRNFADGFVGKISDRMLQMRAKTEESVGKENALVLVKSKSADVDQALGEYFPKLGHGMARARSKFNGAAQNAGQRSGSRADLSGGRNKVGAQKGLGQ